MFIKVAHPVLRISTLCALLFVLLVTFLSYQSKDGSTPPGTRGQFVITATTVTQPDALRILDSQARDLHVNIYKRGYDPENPDSSPWYFSFVGDLKAHKDHMGEENYPAFNPRLVPSVYPGSEVGEQGIIGSYSTTASTEEVRSLLYNLLNAGIQTELVTESEPQIFLQGILASSSAPILVALGLALVLSIFYTATYNLKSNAIKQLHGLSPLRTAGTELLQLTGFLVYCSILSLVALSVGLFCYNGMNQFLPFMTWAVSAVIVLCAFMLLTYIGALILLPRPNALRLLKGSKPLVPLALAAVAAQVLGLMLIYAVVTSSWVANVNLQRDEQSFDRWAPEAHSVTLKINLRTLNDRDPDNIAPAVRKVFKDFLPTYERLNDQGKAILSIHPRQNPGQTSARGLSKYNPDSGNSIIVNNQFLERNIVLDENGKRIADLPAQKNHIDLLVPVSARTQTAQIVDEYRYLNWRRWELGTPMPEAQPLDISVRYVEDDQVIFNYGDTNQMREWTQSGPVVAVVNRAADVFSGWYLLTVAANSGHITFTDPVSISTIATESGLDKHLVSLSSSSVKALEELDKRRAEALVNFTNIIVSAVLLLLSIAIMAAIYIDKNKIAVFVKHTHGWNFLRTHGYYVLGSAAGGAICILLITNLLSDAVRVEKVLALLVGALVLVIATAGVLAAIYLDEKRTRGDFVKRS